MKAIIAAGGSGTRLRPLTFSSNKHLLPIANKPLLLYPLEAIVETGIKEIGVIVNETRPAVENLLGDGSTWGVKITYIPQEKPLGLAHVVRISKDFLDGEPFVYHLGDNIFTEGIMRPFTHFAKTKPDGLLTMVEHEENFRLGVPFFDENGNLEKVVEKPENPPNKYGVPGLYMFSSKVFNAFTGDDAVQPSARGEYEITDLYTYLLQHKYRVEVEEVDGRWMDPGKFVDMLEANAYLLDQQKKPETIAEGASIENCQIIPPVSIGENTHLENCQVGPHVAIDKNCTLIGVNIKNSVVMEETEIANVDTPIVDSLIGRKTHVWEDKADSVSLFIGDHCSVRLT